MDKIIELHPECIDLCWVGDKKDKNTNTCDADMEKILKANPRLLLIILCVVFMIGLSILAYYNLKVVVNYRRALELYQVCLSEFKETPRTKLAKKYLKDDPIMEDEDENMSATQRNTVNIAKSSPPSFQRNVSIRVGP